MPIGQSKASISRYVVVFVFLAYLAIFLASHFSYPDNILGYDPFYHIRHANSYRTGEELSLPVFSTISSRKADLYYLYHLSLAPFTAAFNGENYHTLIVGAKIHHSLTAAALFAIFFIIIRYLAGHSKKTNRKTLWLLAISTLLLLALSPMFRGRLMFIRPHVVSISFLLLTFYYLVRRKVWPLLAVSVLFPLTYSVSFLALIPAAIFVASDYFYHRSGLRGLLQRQTIFYGLIPAFGLIIGILLHPQTNNYLFNAYYIHLMALVRKYGNGLIEGVELRALNALSFEWIWVSIILFLAFTQLANTAFRKKGTPPPISFNRFFLLCTTLFFTLLTVLVSRAVEYAIPFAALSIALTLFADIPKQTWLNSRQIKIALIVFIIFTLAAQVTTTIKAGTSFPPYDYYQDAALFIAANSEPGQLVFYRYFSNYPYLVFFNNHNRYVSGMGSIFTYAFDREKYWLWHHTINQKGNICPERKCDSNTHDIYDVIAKEFGAQVVFLDGWEGTTILKERIEEDDRFTKKFSDSANPLIMVYQVNEPQ